MQITKYTDGIDQLSAAWTFENCEKMVDEAHRVNEIVRQAREPEEKSRRKVGIFGMIGWYAGRLLWKNTQ
jgi:hypothetical protein